jgi:hypothetical protein
VYLECVFLHMPISSKKRVERSLQSRTMMRVERTRLRSLSRDVAAVEARVMSLTWVTISKATISMASTTLGAKMGRCRQIRTMMIAGQTLTPNFSERICVGRPTTTKT